MASGTPLITGMGNLYVKTTNAITNAEGTNSQQQVVLDPFIFSFEFAIETDSIEGQSQRNGILQTHASAQGATTNTLTLSTQYTNFPILAFFMNQVPQVGSLAEAVRKTGTVPASPGPYEVADADITVANRPDTHVYVSKGGANANSKEGVRYRTADAVTAPADATEVQLDTTNNKLIFDADDAGAEFFYYVPGTSASRRYIGGTNANNYGNLELWGNMEPNGALINFPSLDFSTFPTITASGDAATELSVEMSANVSGNDVVPYRIWE